MPSWQNGETHEFRTTLGEPKEEPGTNDVGRPNILAMMNEIPKSLGRHVEIENNQIENNEEDSTDPRKWAQSGWVYFFRQEKKQILILYKQVRQQSLLITCTEPTLKTPRDLHRLSTNRNKLKRTLKLIFLSRMGCCTSKTSKHRFFQSRKIIRNNNAGKAFKGGKSLLLSVQFKDPEVHSFSPSVRYCFTQKFTFVLK